jgi:hypothetical protein
MTVICQNKNFVLRNLLQNIEIHDSVKQSNMVLPSAPPEEYNNNTTPNNANCNNGKENFNTKKAIIALTNKSSLMGTRCLIENYEIEAFFDTGADLSIMAHVTALNYGFEILPTDIKIKIADNIIQNAIGLI